MPITNLMCSICTEIFKNSDDVRSTSCGHLFHFSCLSIWKMRQSNCPQCRREHPRSHKIFLTFDETEQISEIDEVVKVKLASAKHKIVELQQQIEEQKTEFLQLRKQFTSTKKSETKLEKKLSTLKDMESEFMQLQGKYTKSSELRKRLEDQINQRLVRNDCKSQELQTQILQNEAIKTKLDSMQRHSTGGILNEKIKGLKEKIERISDDFEKEIILNTQLSIENMQLRHAKNLQNPMRNINEILTKDCNTNITKNDAKFKSETATQIKFEGSVAQNSETFKTNATQNCELANYVLIKEFPLEQLTVPLENVIILLASKMDLHISKDDLLKVTLLASNNKNSTKARIIVEFKSPQMKDLFLSKKNIFKSDLIFKFICIEDPHKLYLSARNILQNYGYSVFHKNHKIFAQKKGTSNAEVLHIQSETHVQKIKNESVTKNFKTDITKNTAKLKNETETTFKNNATQNCEIANYLLIKEFPLEQLTAPLDNVIILLASKMDLHISKDDLLEVTLLASNNKNSTKAQIFVKFKSPQMKDLFLSKKNIFKNDLIFKFIFIEDPHKLYLSARNILQNCGYSVFHKNHKIFAQKKGTSNAEVLHIQSETHVQKIKNESVTKNCKTDITKNTAKLKNETIKQIKYEGSDAQNCETFKNNATQNCEIANYLLIKEFPLEQLTVPLENVIILLASKMDLHISKDDLLEVTLLASNNKNSTKAQIFVKCKSPQMKDLFLSKKKIFKFLIEDPHELYLYARNILQSYGYSVFYKNHKIFAQKNGASNAAVLHIQSETHVEKIKNESVSKNLKNETPPTQTKVKTSVTQNCEKLKTDATHNPKSANYVLIKHFPVEQLTVPLENVIILLAAKMDFHISTDDLLEVTLLASNNKNSTKAQIFVKFKSPQMKDLFLSKKKNFKFLIEDPHELYLYARNILQSYGYSVFYKNHKIFAQKNGASNAAVLHIQSETHVEKIKNESVSKNLKNETQTEVKTSVTQNCEKLKTDATHNPKSANYVLIKHFPVEQLTVPLENVIILLAAKMEFHISTDDLLEVTLLASNNKKSTKAQIFVEFKSRHIKNLFLIVSNNFKNDSTFKSISIEDLHELYLYARKILQNYGYSVFYKKHKIFAQKNDTSKSEILHIQSKAQVEGIVNIT